MESWPDMNLGHYIAEWVGTYLDHRQKNTDGTEDSLRWCNARDLLREIHDIDSHAQ